MQDEDIVHLMYECPVIKQFWKEIEELFNRKCELTKKIKFSKTFILIGIDNNFISTEILHTIITIGKMHIYRQKTMRRGLSINSFITEVKNRYDCERYNAIINFSLKKHEQNWNPFIPLFKN